MTDEHSASERERGGGRDKLEDNGCLSMRKKSFVGYVHNILSYYLTINIAKLY